MQARLKEIADKLEKMTIYDVRQIAREVRAQVTSGQKGEIIDSILSYAKGEAEAKPLSSRGAPPKSVKHDEALVAEIRKVRGEYLTEGSVNNVLSVADGAAENERDICGVLNYSDGEFYIYAENSKTQVAPSFISRYSLRVGDKISGKTKKINPELQTLLTVDGVNGALPSEMVGRANFSSLTPAYPVNRIMLSRGDDTPASALIDLFIPLAFGQRAVILSPAHGGKTTLIKEIASGISAGYPQAEIIILQLGAKPEELTDFKRAFPDAGRFTTGFCAGADENTAVANLAFEHAKRLAELGKDAVILADGLVSACGAEVVKRLFSGVCNTEEGGTVTAVVTLSDSGAEEVVSAANAVITISEELSAARVYPAVDVKKSYAYREETLLSKDAFSAANALRAKFSARDIVRLVNDNPDADKITENYKNG